MNDLNVVFNKEVIEKNIIRLINQLWKLIPMKENNEEWEKQLDTVIIEVAGLGEIFNQDPQFLQLLAKLRGLKIVNIDFPMYRKTVFESIALLKDCFNQYQKKTLNDNIKITPISGINEMARRLRYYGGAAQQDRMIQDKRKTLDKAVLYSYQGALVKKIQNSTSTVAEDMIDLQPVRALINPDKTKQDYDDKIISIGFEYNFQPGDVFEWCNTNSFWLIYLQDLTELAYFRGEIRKCKYQIEWLDDEGNTHSTYAAVRGPVETKIDYIQKHGISVDNPNLSLNLLMPLNADTKQYFQRYSKFYLQDQDICWRVEAVDWISTPGILEIAATEYYANKDEDDIENGIVGSLIIKEPESTEATNINRIIKGDTFIKPKRTYTYIYTGLDDDGQWEINQDLPIEYTIQNTTITLKWTASYSGQFDLKFKDITKTIVVESLF